MRKPSLAFALALAGCLGPETNDMIDPSRVFGDPAIDPQTALHVEDDPLLADHVKQFSREVAYLNGFASGHEIRYWNVDGPNATFIASIYQLLDLSGQPMGERIIDAIPGDAGYTPWWRVVTVKITEKYAGERIWSRAAIDVGVKSGILEAPVDTVEVVDCPVVLQTTEIPVGTDTPAKPVWGWYRNRRVHYIDFQTPRAVELGVRDMPIFPVYVLQRIDEGLPLYEFLTGVDLNGDDDLADTNNIFAEDVGGARYSPLWYVTFVRTVSDYVSIDNSRTGTVGLSAEDQFLDDTGRVISPLVVPDRVIPMPTFLVNCAIQRVMGEL